MRLSVIMPGRKEPFMQRTIDSFLQASELGYDLEIIPVLDGPYIKNLTNDLRVKPIRMSPAQGMRAAINAGLDIATGDYVMKVDAHCCFAPGFDGAMMASCRDNWLVIPRRYALDDVRWEPNKVDNPRDYHYLLYPANGQMTVHHWERQDDPEIDDVMTFQGSCWIANRAEFMQRVGFLDDDPETYGSFAAEQLEVGLKYWLGGGAVKVNKKTWYAHLWKMPRHYASGRFEKKQYWRENWCWATRHWINDEEPGMAHPFSWLVEKFWPVPTWPNDRSQWRRPNAVH